MMSILYSLLSGITFTSFGWGDDLGEYHRIESKDAKKMIDEGGVTIVDVRTREEFELGHIENAILIPVETIGETEPKELPDKNATILIYCRTGRRSRDAAMKLLRMGYQNVYDFGGILEWDYDIVM